MEDHMNYSEAAIAYLLNKAQSDKSAALASLTLLLNHPAGVGDHSTADLHRSLEESLERLSSADGKIETIQNYFLNKPSEDTSE